MDGLDKIFESLDDKIFTTDLKLKLKQQFNESVERKSDEFVDMRLEEELEKLNEKSNEYIEKLDEEYQAKIEERIEFLNEKAEEFAEIKAKELSETLVEDKIEERIEFLNEKAEEFAEIKAKELSETLVEDKIEKLNEKAEEFAEIKAKELSETLVEDKIEKLNEKAEEYIEFLNEKAEEFAELQREKLAESVSGYMDRVVEEFVSETKETLAESVKSSHADMLIEAFDSMIVAGGVKIADIVESREVTGDEALEESKRKYDRLVNENIELAEQNDKLIKMGVISEVKEGLSLVEADKFESLAELVEFSKSGDYLKKLEKIRESVVGAKNVESVPASRTSNVTSINENTSSGLIYSHLL